MHSARFRSLIAALRLCALLLAVAALAGACKPGGDAKAKGGPGGPAGAGGGAGGPGGGGKKGPVAFAVEVQPVTRRPMEYTLAAVGSLIPFEEAQIAARVGGSVDRVLFREGDAVEAGQVLVEIEPQRYRVAVDQGKATVKRAQAGLDDALRTLQRKRDMGPEVASGEETDAAAAKVQISRAELDQAKAALNLAELNLRDARVRAPLAGVVQARKVQTGAYLQPGAVVASILRRDPLRVRFALAEMDAQRLKIGLEVRFRVRGVEGWRGATVQHIAGRADESSRQVEVLADVQAVALPRDPSASGGEIVTGGELRAGAFAEVVVPIGAPYPAVAIPQIAIRPSEKGFLAYVIEGDKARERIVELGMRSSDGMVEVRKGLKEGEKLVIVGAEALREGAAVRVVQPGSPAKPAGKGRPDSAELPSARSLPAGASPTASSAGGRAP